MTSSSLRITYCWTRGSGYLRACIAALADRGVAAHVLFWQPSLESPFSEASLSLPNATILNTTDRQDFRLIREHVLASQPDLVVIPGWSHRPYTRLLTEPKLRDVPFVMTADTAIRHDWRQRIGGFRLQRLLNKVAAVCVPGDRGFQLMRAWGVPPSKIFRLLYGIDFQAFAAAGQRRAIGPNQRFVFAGRYVAAKGIEVLMAAYGLYRQRVATPWELHAAGAGALAHLVVGERVVNHGFLQPADLTGFFGDGGVFVLPSRYEPWGQVIVEAAAAKMPVLCSTECGAGPEIVKDFHSGRIVPAGDPKALAEAMIWMHEHADRLDQMGFNAQSVAVAYSAERWAENQESIGRTLLRRR